MKYDFDTLVERRGTHCCKFDTIPEEAGKNAIPVSIADMDLPCAEPIIRALHERIDQRIFGYTVYENEDCNGSDGSLTKMIYSSVRVSFLRWHF